MDWSRALLLFFFVSVMMTVSCTGKFGEGETGQIELSFGPSYKAMTRAGVEIPDTGDFILTVREPDGNVVFQGRYCDSPEKIKVKAGSCQVSIISEEFSTPAFSKVQYGDDQCVMVPSDGVVTVRLVCAQINSGIRLKIAPEFLTACPNSVLFLKSESGKLMYGYSEKRIAYFPPGNVSLIMLTGQQEETLLTRSLLAREILTIGVGAVASSASSPAREGISIQIDTSRVWTEDNYVIGGEPSSGGAPDESMTIAQAKASIGAKAVWVSAYIVGGNLTATSARFDPPFTSKTNLLIGPRSTIMDRESGMSVSLPASSIRDDLNLVDHPDLLGRKIMLKGDIVEAYFGLPGIKNITEYKFQ